ncbi:unnamed protein product [Durusdinium trenchii]|uniref:Non-specific serine/threonine protein kinase n=3 Tax=Durusdinium trenchii TaxID=1381693 RepID=A0ABP0RVS9_9DINO
MPCEPIREHVSGVAQSAAVLSLTSGVLGSFPGASRTGSKSSSSGSTSASLSRRPSAGTADMTSATPSACGSVFSPSPAAAVRSAMPSSCALPIKPRSVSICESSMGGTSLPIRSRSDTGSSLTLPIKGRSVSESACDADRPASGLALPIRSRSSLEPGRSGLELPIAGRSVVASADRKRSEVREEGPCAAGARTEPATQATAASCGVALLNCVFSDWDSEESKSPMTKAKSNPQLTGSPGDETPVSSCSHRRMSSNVQYKGFISQHSSDISVYDRYDFGELLGEGAAGSTWEAFPRVRETRSGTRARRLSGQERPRAIKKVPKRRVSNSTESFLAEVEVLKELDHPNICKLYEVFEDADNIFLVMELCRGGELFDRITQGELGGEAQVAKLIQQLAHAVRYCHDRGIIHRDIKPENILFVSPEPDAPAKLIDFGIACHFKQTEHRRDEKGTEAYLAPEVKDNSSYTEKCDLWSLGVLLYAMLSGSLPFKSAAAARSGDFSLEAEEWQQISSEAKDLIRHLLVVEPCERLSAAKVLEHPWVTASLEEEAVPVKVQVRLRRYQSTSYFRRILLLVVARQLGANDLPEIYKTFKAMDTNGDGSLSLEEFQKCLSNGSGSPSPEAHATPEAGEADELSELFEALDADGSGAIDYSEFMAAAIDRKIFFREELCLQVFAALDRDSSGTISIQELFQLLKAADPEDLLGNELRDEVMELLDRYDTDRDGELSFREFRALLTQNREGSPPKRLQKRVSQGSDLMTKSPSY